MIASAPFLHPICWRHRLCLWCTSPARLRLAAVPVGRDGLAVDCDTPQQRGESHLTTIFALPAPRSCRLPVVYVVDCGGRLRCFLRPTALLSCVRLGRFAWRERWSGLASYKECSRPPSTSSAPRIWPSWSPYGAGVACAGTPTAGLLPGAR